LAERHFPDVVPDRSATQRSLVHARFEALQIPKMLLADLAIHPDDAGSDSPAAA